MDRRPSEIMTAPIYLGQSVYTVYRPSAFVATDMVWQYTTHTYEYMYIFTIRYTHKCYIRHVCRPNAISVALPAAIKTLNSN